MSNNLDRSSISTLPQLLQQLDERLARVERLTSLLGAEAVKRLVFEPDSTENRLLDNQPSPKTHLLSRVEALGVELNPTLVAHIVNSSVEDVQASIAIYSTYLKRGAVGNPNGLFYTILMNRQKSNHKLVF